AVVDPQAALALDGHDRGLVRVGLAERASRALELPAAPAAAAREQALAAGIGSQKLRHRGERSTERAVAAQPPLVVPAVGAATATPERRPPRSEAARRRGPSQEAQQAR